MVYAFFFINSILRFVKRQEKRVLIRRTQRIVRLNNDLRTAFCFCALHSFSSRFSLSFFAFGPSLPAVYEVRAYVDFEQGILIAVKSWFVEVVAVALHRREWAAAIS